MTTLGDLERAYPDWSFGVHWTTRPSGPDVRQVYAECEGIKLLAFEPSGLLRLLTEHHNGAPLKVSKKSE